MAAARDLLGSLTFASGSESAGRHGRTMQSVTGKICGYHGRHDNRNMDARIFFAQVHAQVGGQAVEGGFGRANILSESSQTESAQAPRIH